MTDKAKYGRRNVPKMLAEWNALRAACRGHGTPDIQDALDQCEEWIDFAFASQPTSAKIGGGA